MEVLLNHTAANNILPNIHFKTVNVLYVLFYKIKKACISNKFLTLKTITADKIYTYTMLQLENSNSVIESISEDSFSSFY